MTRTNKLTGAVRLALFAAVSTQGDRMSAYIFTT